MFALIITMFLTVLSHFFGWVVENWIALGFGLSELLALFPGKYSGLIQSIWKVLSALLVKEKEIQVDK